MCGVLGGRESETLTETESPRGEQWSDRGGGREGERRKENNGAEGREERWGRGRELEETERVKKC